MKTRDVIRELVDAGAVLVRKRGDHHIYKLPTGLTVSVSVGGTRNEITYGMVHKVRKLIAQSRGVQ